MTYFSNFPQTLYQVSPASFRKAAEYVYMTDIFRNVRFKREVIDNISLYDFISMQEGDTIEIVSERLYGSPYYHWVLMLLNDRYDYKKDLPLSAFQFEKYIEHSYPLDYLDETYGLIPESFLIDIADYRGFSVDINDIVGQETTNIINRNTGEIEFSRPILSIQAYDDTLKKRYKKFIYKDDATYLDTKTHRIDWGSMPRYSPRYAYEMELLANESKRRIKIISRSILNKVLQDFKELM